MVECSVHEISHGFCIRTHTKRIERGCRIGIKQGDAQIVIIRNETELLVKIILIPTDTGLPFPGLQFVPGVGELSQVPSETAGEVVIIDCDFIVTPADVPETTKLYTRSELRPRRRGTRRIDGEARIKSAHRCVIRHREWVECVLSGHADALGADEKSVRRIDPEIRRKRRSRKLAIPETAEVFEVGKHGQVLIAKIAIKRTVQILTIGCSYARCKIPEVKGSAFRRYRSCSHVLSIVELVCRRVWGWRHQTTRVLQPFNTNEIPGGGAGDSPCHVTAAEI